MRDYASVSAKGMVLAYSSLMLERVIIQNSNF